MKTENENSPKWLMGHLHHRFSVLSNLPPLLGFQLRPFEGFELFLADLFAEEVAEQLRQESAKERNTVYCIPYTVYGTETTFFWLLYALR